MLTGGIPSDPSRWQSWRVVPAAGKMAPVYSPRSNGSNQPLQADEVELAERIGEALRRGGTQQATATAEAIDGQIRLLHQFGDLLAGYPSPLEEQNLGGRKRGLETLVDTLVGTDQATFAFRAPTQALVGRALTMAQVNFFRMLWHVCTWLEDPQEAATLREVAARKLRAGVYCRLVEEVLAALVTDQTVARGDRVLAARHLALLWGHRLTWRAHDFFPILEATWEARQRVRVVGGTLLGTSELFQLLTSGADTEFVVLLTGREHAEHEVLAFREFLFGASSEELERVAERMSREGLTSVELDSQLGQAGRDAGSILYEFFQARFVQAGARRVANLPGPRHTAEAYVLLAWLGQCPVP